MWVSFSVSIIIRCVFSLAYNIFFQLANELFPTSLRGRGVCLMRMLGDIGTSVAPFIIALVYVNRIIMVRVKLAKLTLF